MSIDVEFEIRDINPVFDAAFISIHNVVESMRKLILQEWAAQPPVVKEFLASVLPPLSEQEHPPTVLNGLREISENAEDLADPKSIEHLFEILTHLLILYCCAVNGARPIPLILPPDIDLTKSPEKLWCYEYALLKLGEKRILEDPDYNVSDVPVLLDEWGYQRVNRPRPGDLVVFFNDEEESTHLGIWRGDGKVESKWWDSIPLPFIHKLEDSPSTYGQIIRYFRKP